MSIWDSFELVRVGDKIRVHRGRSPDYVGEVVKVTPKQFGVAGYGMFWKKNGKGVGDADSWYGRYANHLQPGDNKRIVRETARRKDGMTLREFNTSHDMSLLNDLELNVIAEVIRTATKRHEETADE